MTSSSIGNKLERVVSGPSFLNNNNKEPGNKLETVIHSTDPKPATPKTQAQNLVPVASETPLNPFSTFGQSTLGNSFARFMPLEGSSNLNYLANTTLPVALTPVDNLGRIIGESTTNPFAYSQATAQHQQQAVRDGVTQILNPFGIPLSPMG